jgi:hypothetical protein
MLEADGGCSAFGASRPAESQMDTLRRGCSSQSGVERGGPGVSRFTVYNYMEQLRRREQE